MTELPQPLTPTDCNLRDFLFMPLDVARLRDSKGVTILTGDEFRCSVLLWCAAWHQVPSASLPDDDIELAQIAGFGRVIKAWKKVRAGALRGWIKCSDGRLYHPVVAEKANEAWAGRVKYREEKEKERIRKAEIRAAKKAEEDAAKALLSRATSDFVPDLSTGQHSNVHRTNGTCPPDSALRGTVDSGEGQWTVDSGQLTSKTRADDDSTATGSASAELSEGGSPREAKLPTREKPPLSEDPAVQLTVALRRQGVNVMSTNPYLLQWVADGVTLEQLTEAVGVARETKGDTAKIVPGYLVPILDKIRNPPAAAPASNGKPRIDDWGWRKSNGGIDAKGRDMGMHARGGESYPDFANRIQKEIDKRKGQQP